METQDSGNGARAIEEATVECSQCNVCQDDSGYWGDLCHLLDTLATMLLPCIHKNNAERYNCLSSHVSALFVATKEQIEIQRERLH